MAITFSDAQVLGQCRSSLITLADGYQIHQAIEQDWLGLVAAAQKDGIELAIASSYRSFEQQLNIWNNKAQGKRLLNDRNNQPLCFESLTEQQLLSAILNWSALPGASRHHWGCDIDVYCPTMIAREQLKLEPWEYQQGGPMEKLGSWLDSNLKRFGFYRPYQFDRGGVAIEPWHISHKKVSKIATKQLSLATLHDAIAHCDIRLKPQILDTLESIYNQYVINTESP